MVDIQLYLSKANKFPNRWNHDKLLRITNENLGSRIKVLYSNCFTPITTFKLRPSTPVHSPKNQPNGTLTAGKGPYDPMSKTSS